MKQLCIWLFCSFYAFANPHFFIDVSVNLELNVIHFEWKFDRINSVLLFFEADRDKNKILDIKEEKVMIKKFFTPLEKENYFVIIEQDNQLRINPKNIHINYDKKRFVILFDVKVEEFERGVVCNIDPIVYFAFRLKDFQSTLKSELQKDRYDFCIGVGE